VFIDKPNARLFAATILVFGLILRGLVTERAQKKAVSVGLATEARMEAGLVFTAPISETSGPAMLCASVGIGRTLDFAVQESKETDRPLYLLFVRQQPNLAPEGRKRKWIDDDEAKAIFAYAKDKAEGHTMLPCYAVSDSAADTIVDIAATVGASYLILGAPERNMIVNLLRGNIIRNISSILPEEIHLLVYA
jgi:hypothetical protein